MKIGHKKIFFLVMSLGLSFNSYAASTINPNVQVLSSCQYDANVDNMTACTQNTAGYLSKDIFFTTVVKYSSGRQVVGVAIPGNNVAQSNYVVADYPVDSDDSSDKPVLMQVTVGEGGDKPFPGCNVIFKKPNTSVSIKLIKDGDSYSCVANG